MNPFRFVFDWLADRLLLWARCRNPDFTIGGVQRPYLWRWYLTPWRRWYKDIPDDQQSTWQWFVNHCPNAYLHCFLRDDDDRALHDHPWAWCSILLQGAYIEHTIDAGGIHRRRLREAPSIKFSLPRRAHRVELLPANPTSMLADGSAPRLPAWTLFLMGPRLRNWGFHCPERGWVPWQEFTDPADAGQTGKGCEA